MTGEHSVSEGDAPWPGRPVRGPALCSTDTPSGLSSICPRNSWKRADTEWHGQVLVVTATCRTRYTASDQIRSGQPNSALVGEIADEAPRYALDVGCGEGADAVWLALRRWRVTALDVSPLALDRARNAARNAGVDIGRQGQSRRRGECRGTAFMESATGLSTPGTKSKAKC